MKTLAKSESGIWASLIKGSERSDLGLKHPYHERQFRMKSLEKGSLFFVESKVKVQLECQLAILHRKSWTMKLL